MIISAAERLLRTPTPVREHSDRWMVLWALLVVCLVADRALPLWIKLSSSPGLLARV